jgi:phospholipid-binding lipoprotein MlaA
MNKNGMIRLAMVALLVLPAAACSSNGSEADYDPLEDWNRGVYWFNDKLDTYLINPVATAYEWVLPDPVEHAIGRFFTNLAFPIHFINNLFQGKPEEAFVEMGRFVVNSTIGVGGLFDPATEFGIPAYPEDFGQTLAVWGVGPGPYLVLPLLGPSNMRDAVGLVADGVSQPLVWLLDDVYIYGGAGLNFINRRAGDLPSIEAFLETALDPYAAMRNAYYQHRQAQILDVQDALPPEDSLYEMPPDAPPPPDGKAPDEKKP